MTFLVTPLLLGLEEGSIGIMCKKLLFGTDRFTTGGHYRQFFVKIPNPKLGFIVKMSKFP